jgi:hypothetical protein
MDGTVTVRKIEVKHSKSSEYHEAIRLAVRLLMAKLTKDKRNKELCVCLEIIGDNGKCPVHR